MRVLLLSAWFPSPPSNGSRLRVHHLLHALAPRHEVAFLGFADEPDVDPHALRELCSSVEVLPLPPFDPNAWRSRLAWLSPRPRWLTATLSPPMIAAVTRTAPSCDVIVASQLRCAAYAPWFAGKPALMEEVELGAFHGQLQQDSTARRWRARLMWTKLQRYLRSLMPLYRAYTVVSEPERALLTGVLGHECGIHVLPNGVDTSSYHSDATPEPDTVIFTGSLRYAPNHDGMRWFIAEVWPHVRRARPAARLCITGDHAGLPLPDAPGVERTGFVDDVRPRLSASWLALAPIFTGGGTRIKILEAMAAGTPVVATSKGAEGIAARAGEQILIADDAASFAAQVVALLTDPSQRARLAQAARHLVVQQYDWNAIGPRFADLVQATAHGQ